MSKKLLIFDVDGTVWDSEKDVFLAFNHTLKEQDGFEISKEQFQELAGMPLEKMFETVLPEEKKNLSTEYAKLYRKYYIEEGHYVDATILFPHVKETLEKFQKEGIAMAVASSKPNRVLDKMVENFGLNCFSYVIGTGESDFKDKPDPDSLIYIMNQLNINKEDAIMIGDSKSDILAGKNAGIETVAVTYGYDKVERLIEAKPDYIIEDFGKLEEVLK